MLDSLARGARACEATGRRPSGLAAATSFRAYVLGRTYDYGRGRADSWAFIAFARGDEEFPEIASLTELRRYVGDARAELLEGATSVWRSFVAHRSLLRRSER